VRKTRPVEEENRTERTSQPVLETEEKENSSFTLVELMTPREPVNTLRRPIQPINRLLPKLKMSHTGANFWMIRSRAIFHQEIERETVITQKCTGNRPSFTANPRPNIQSEAKLLPKLKIKSRPEISRRKDPHA